MGSPSLPVIISSETTSHPRASSRSITCTNTNTTIVSVSTPGSSSGISSNSNDLPEFPQGFVPPMHWGASAEDLLSLSRTKRAVLVDQNPSDQTVRRAFVNTGYEHGDIKTGGPPGNPHGYCTVERSGVVVHNRGRQLVGGKSINLGPAYGNGSEHGTDCRIKSRLSEYQGTCFCEPISKEKKLSS